MLDIPSGSIPLRYTDEVVPDDSDGQVLATIRRMNQYVCEDCTNPAIVYDAQCALSLDPSNPLGAVHSFVSRRLRFRNDEEITQPFESLLPRPSLDGGKTGDYFVECLKRPVDVSTEFARTGQPVEGDCDDYSMYCAALLKALGINCAFATVGASSKDPSVYSHVYVVAYIDGHRIPMDCSHGKYAGWEVFPPNCGVKYAEWVVVEQPGFNWMGLALVVLAFFAWRNKKGIVRELFAL